MNLKCCRFTLKHVHHAKERQRERGFSTAGPATDPNLKPKRPLSPILNQPVNPNQCLAKVSVYLLAGADVCIDVFEHRLQGGVVSDTQVLDLDLSLPGPAVRDLRHSWAQGQEHRRSLTFIVWPLDHNDHNDKGKAMCVACEQYDTSLQLTSP